MRRRYPVIAAALLAAVLATVGHAQAAMVGRSTYCVPTDEVSVGHICVLLG